MEPYENLANAIVKKAADDYIKVLKRLKRFPNDRDADSEKKQIERFFHSAWYRILTEIDAEYLIGLLKAVVA